jgi:ribonuclease P protein component
VAVQYEPVSPSDSRADDLVRVAYSVPKQVGKAVERNRHRRRLRAIALEASPSLPPGAYLVGVDAGVRDLSFQELRTRVMEAMLRASSAGER